MGERLTHGIPPWLMEFHPQKCHVLHITFKRKSVGYLYHTVHGNTLEEVSSAKSKTTLAGILT